VCVLGGGLFVRLFFFIFLDRGKKGEAWVMRVGWGSEGSLWGVCVYIE
jgi:hypothetical protein